MSKWLLVQQKVGLRLGVGSERLTVVFRASYVAPISRYGRVHIRIHIVHAYRNVCLPDQNTHGTEGTATNPLHTMGGSLAGQTIFVGDVRWEEGELREAPFIS